jgi:hypothetical protein
MRTRPHGADLLACAQTLLREELIKSLPPEQKHNALMIANAMAVAARQLQAGEAPEREEGARLSGLLEHSLEAENALCVANRALAALIRGGWADPGQSRRADVFAHLRQVVRQAVAESNPKYLG